MTEHIDGVEGNFTDLEGFFDNPRVDQQILNMLSGIDDSIKLLDRTKQGLQSDDINNKYLAFIFMDLFLTIVDSMCRYQHSSFGFSKQIACDLEKKFKQGLN